MGLGVLGQYSLFAVTVMLYIAPHFRSGTPQGDVGELQDELCCDLTAWAQTK